MNALERAVFDAHKRAHGLTPDHKHWYDERWEEGGVWYFNARAFLEVLGVERFGPSEPDPGMTLYRIKAIPPTSDA